jgi:hypothetical protein
MEESMPFDGTEFVDHVSPGTSRASEASPVPARAFLTPSSPPAPSPAVRLLREARSLIAAPERWARGRYATEDDRHCAVGALRAAARVTGDADALRRAHRLLLQIAIRRGFQSVERMNDESSHHHVVSAVDEAIRKAECDRLLPAYLR